MAQQYFSIKGNERDGWTLMKYTFQMKKMEDGTEQEIDAVSPDWQRPKEFAKLAPLLQELLEYEQIEGEPNG